MAGRITDLDDAGALDGAELIEVSKLSGSVTISATTISVDDTDNSLNDSGSGFIAAGFAANDRVKVEGFTTTSNNLFFGVIESLTTAKMVIASPEGDLLATEAAGDSVTITKWISARTTSQSAADLGGGSVSVEDDGSEIIAAAATLNFTGSGVVVTDGGGGQADIAISGGGGGGGGGGSESDVLIVRHQVASNTGGGTPTAGAWTTRTLNDEQANEIAGASLASNQVTLPAGTYRVRAAQEFFRTQRTLTRLRNVTDGTTLLVSNVAFANDTDNSHVAWMEGTITLAASKTIELQYYADSAAGAGNGLGVNSTAASAESPVFALIAFARVNDTALGSTIEEAGASANLLNSNAGNYQRWTATGAKTLTVQEEATEAIDQDAEFYIANRAASGDLTIVEGGAYTVINVPSGGGLVLQPGMAATLKRVQEDEFDLIGQTTA